MSDQEPKLQFPCEYDIKIMGKKNSEFESVVIGILNKHIPDLKEGAIKERPSAKGNYVSLTANFHAESKKQLDDLYQELSDNPHVLMAL